MKEITISRGTSNRIRVSFPYNKDYVAKIKTIDGHRWHPESKYWSFPNDKGIVEKILSAFSGENISIGPTLQKFDALERELVSKKFLRKF